VIEIERFNVLTAISAEEALEILSQNKINAVISDIMLPGMTGLELLAKIKTKNISMPVIMITAHGRQFTSQEALGMGADEFFAKPFKNVEIVSALRRLITKNEKKVAVKVNT
jgi:DNA-binding response OmpR family regulator